MEAERLAMEDCMRGVDVRREWSETEMVRSFAGGMLPGTPDGMYEDWNGNLSCVQVVRVPITPCMSFGQIEELLYQTVLVKVWKSQTWMEAMHCLPHEFIIFCWLPFQPPGGTGDKAQMFVERLRGEGWPFRFRCKLPSNPSELFPAKFAYRRAGREGGLEGCGPGKTSISEEDLSTLDPSDFLNDEEDESLPDFDLFADPVSTEADKESSSLVDQLCLSSEPGSAQEASQVME